MRSCRRTRPSTDHHCWDVVDGRSMKPGNGVLGRRTAALLGLAGAVLSGVGDVLILGRPCSGREFDEATGRIPPNIDADPRWRSLWNGASFAPGRLHAGTLIGVAGIGVLQWAGLHAAARAVPPGRLRRLATVSAAGFAVSGVLTHLGCGTVILAYRRAAEDADDSDGRQSSPRSATTMLAVSALGALGALALFSGAVIGAAARRPDTTPRGRAVMAPFPCVLATLADLRDATRPDRWLRSARRP